MFEINGALAPQSCRARFSSASEAGAPSPRNHRVVTQELFARKHEGFLKSHAAQRMHLHLDAAGDGGNLAQ